MSITQDQVKKVAKLANLPISSTDEVKYAEQLSKILDYIENLNKLETKNIEPTFNVRGNIENTREDEVKPSLTQDEALMNAPQKRDGFFITKGIFNND